MAAEIITAERDCQEVLAGSSGLQPTGDSSPLQPGGSADDPAPALSVPTDLPCAASARCRETEVLWMPLPPLRAIQRHQPPGLDSDGHTFSALFVAALAVLVHRYSGNDLIVVGIVDPETDLHECSQDGQRSADGTIRVSVDLRDDPAFEQVWRQAASEYRRTRNEAEPAPAGTSSGFPPATHEQYFSSARFEVDLASVAIAAPGTADHR